VQIDSTRKRTRKQDTKRTSARREAPINVRLLAAMITRAEEQAQVLRAQLEVSRG